ncbi:MAG: hypothetical protein GEV05_27110 [Betaproteobacteria bacterium]|nr:hypothetical protein [Betaproteobacteria bacterium]
MGAERCRKPPLDSPSPDDLGVLYAQKWENPDIYSPFNVTGSPSLVVCKWLLEEGAAAAGHADRKPAL